MAEPWSEWSDPATGEVLPNCTMLTQNGDGHPVLGLMHRPEKDRPVDQQDKRSMVPIERTDWGTWLNGSQTEASALIQVPAPESRDHGPVDGVGNW